MWVLLSLPLRAESSGDRNCPGCRKCCVDYALWLRFQNALFVVVHDTLFDACVTLCIVLNTAFLAAEHHGMSEDLKHTLDLGNKVGSDSIQCNPTSLSSLICGWCTTALYACPPTIGKQSELPILRASLVRSLGTNQAPPKRVHHAMPTKRTNTHSFRFSLRSSLWRLC